MSAPETTINGGSEWEVYPVCSTSLASFFVPGGPLEGCEVTFDSETMLTAIQDLSPKVHPHFPFEVFVRLDGDFTSVLQSENQLQSNKAFDQLGYASVETNVDESGKERKIGAINLALVRLANRDNNSSPHKVGLRARLQSTEELNINLVHELQHMADFANPRIIDQQEKYEHRHGLDGEEDRVFSMKEFIIYENSPLEKRARSAEKKYHRYVGMITISRLEI